MYNENMSIDVRVSHINVHQPASDAIRKYNIDGVVKLVKDYRGVGTLNEFGKSVDHKYLASINGIGSYIYGELAVLWDESRFERVLATRYLIMRGGHVGADGKPGGDDRRVGPSRWLLLVVLRDKATGITFQVNTTHLVARADTVAKWRRGIRAASIKLTGLFISKINNRYPNGVLNGDMNFVGPLLDFPYLSETQLPTLSTFGNMHYDRSFVWGEVKLTRPARTFKRLSDHLGFTFVMTIGSGSTPNVPPISHTGTGSVKPKPSKPGHVFPGAPVAHPWAPRNRRWRRLHPIVWRRILRWRKNHKR